MGTTTITSTTTTTATTSRSRRRRKHRVLLLGSLSLVLSITTIIIWRFWILPQPECSNLDDNMVTVRKSSSSLQRMGGDGNNNLLVNNNNNNNNHHNNNKNEDDAMANDECCAVMCTTPPDTCCLPCTYLSSPREHDLLMAMMEGLTLHLMEKHSSSSSSDSAIASGSTNQQHNNAWLQTRAWEGNSHIGNRPEQATFYYDWIRSINGILSSTGEAVQHVCEIGMNGGHSALIFLAALSETTVTTTISTTRIRRQQKQQQPQDDHEYSHDGNADTKGDRNDKNTAKLTMFDRFEFDYSPSAMSYIQNLYPGRFELRKGDSTITVPEWILATEEAEGEAVADHEESNKCDVFSVDGDHSYEGARRDILNAARATKTGGKIILDDMNPDGPTRRAFDSVLSLGQGGDKSREEDDEKVVLTDPRCVEDVYIRVGYDDRINGTNAREMHLSWCSATVV